ncbi:MAG: aminotransferase class III-fold pyridoxal phosphate-dependent enzyme [Dissulfuribacterales bacterium]
MAGYLTSATCFKPELESFFQKDPFVHISTFGGAEVGCPVALAVLDITSSPDFLEHVRDLASIFKDGFDRLKAKHPEILVGLRQLGLMMGIEMVLRSAYLSVPTSSSLINIWAYPRIIPRGLFIACAIPADSRPMEASFSVCAIWFSISLLCSIFFTRKWMVSSFSDAP